MGVLGDALVRSRSEEALPVLEASLALTRRYWSRDEKSILCAQSGLANCLNRLRRHDEALVLQRDVYARFVAIKGLSHERTILAGSNLVGSLNNLKLWNESKPLLCDLLPAARQSLGSDHDLTLGLHYSLAVALVNNPGRTRENLC